MEFKNYSFKDLLSHIVDNRGKTCPVENIGIPLIATNCIKDDSLYAEYERIRFVSDDTYKTWFRGHPEPEDIIFVCKGSPGRVAWVQNPVPYCIAQDMVAIRANKSLIDSKFLFALLRNPSTQKSILNMHVGTMIPHFKKGDFSNLYFDIPQDLAYQKWAGELYFSFSEKIELNKQTNQTLEQMAQALFKSWFVDFDPVFDNAFDAGLSVDDFPDELQHRAMLRQQHRSEAMQQGAEAMMPQTPQSTAVLQPQNQQTTQTESEHIRGLFPSEFEQCDDPSVGINGWIPKDWIAKSVSEVINVNPRTSLPKNSIAKFADMKALPTIGYMVNQITKKEFSGGAKFKQHDILLARITPCLENGKTALVDFLNDEEVGFGSTEFIVLRQKNKLSYSFIACLARDENFRKHCIQNMVGSSGRQRVQNSCFDIYLLSVPSNEKIFEKFTDLTKPNFEKMTINNNEINYLSKIRDTLLPKLISGELKFSEAVQSIETK
ncbi:restriction endonuclease subunit S [Shewanella frigidimarina]|uniref:restriction endonuclease subunit S n=1 Tax=Shewanella frigidimarina TaxID=56812 RepID=UPI0014050C4A|nr:restriction endonuclease subunit S [Shewanella frigidimarina]